MLTWRDLEKPCEARDFTEETVSLLFPDQSAPTSAAVTEEANSGKEETRAPEAREWRVDPVGSAITIWRGDELFHTLKEKEFTSAGGFPVARDGSRAVFRIHNRGKVLSRELDMGELLPAEKSLLVFETGPDGNWRRSYPNCEGLENMRYAVAVSEGARLSLLAELRRSPPRGDDGTRAHEWAVLTWKDPRNPCGRLPVSGSSLRLLFRK